MGSESLVVVVTILVLLAPEAAVSNSETTPFSFSLTSGQSVNFTAPLNGEFVKDLANISIQYNGGAIWDNNTGQWVPVPATEIVLKIDNITIKTWDKELSFSGTVNYTWNTKEYGDGLHLLYVWQENALGDTVSSQIEIKVDNTPPDASILSPTPYSWVKGEITPTLYIKELGCMNRIEIYVDGVLQDVINLNSTLNESYTLPWSWHTCDFSDGGHILGFLLYDVAGNSVSIHTTYFIDNTAPTFRILSPYPGHWVKEGDNIVLDLEDTGSGINTIKIYVNQSLEYVVRGKNWSSPYTINWHWARYPEGKITLLIMVYDVVGNIASTSVSYNVDNTPPSLHITSGNITLRNTLNYTLNYYATDNFHISYYSITIIQKSSSGTGLWKKINTTQNNITLEFEDNSTYIINIRAYDEAGNFAEKKLIIIVDYNYPPRLVESIIPETIKAGKMVTFYAKGKDIDGDTLNYTWFIDGKKVGIGKYLNVTLSSGEHILKLIINDGFHNVSYTWIIIVEGNKEESENISPLVKALLDWLLYLFLFIGLVILLAGALMMMKKKK